MEPKFGTSGLRGLVADLTPELVGRYVSAFLTVCKTGDRVFVGFDLRPSSADIAQMVMESIHAHGLGVVPCGAVPTPALALAANEAGAAAIMITGSHIPADRNGLKFYSTDGEITKEDEGSILAALSQARLEIRRSDRAEPLSLVALRGFIARYVSAFGPEALQGRRIGLFEHSAVGRDVLAEVLTKLGAIVITLGRSEIFVPVDTEAVDRQTRERIQMWVREHQLDALVSTDGDSDRPLLADERGVIVPGDIMGQITAEALEAETVVTPISSNSGVLQKGFAHVLRTRIGSPHVIAGMKDTRGKSVGYEANGGFILGFTARGPAGALSPLMTRDCLLPLIVTLCAAGHQPISERVAQEPPVVTKADRLQGISPKASARFTRALSEDGAMRDSFLTTLGLEFAAMDLTDGPRMTCTNGMVVHIRPSGNAPELRLYVEASSQPAAEKTLARGLDALAQHLRH